MPAPEKKISSHNDSPCEIKLACSVEVAGKTKDEAPDTTTSGKESSDPCKKGSAKPGGKKCSATSVKKIEESQAELNKEECPNKAGLACQMPRPDLSATTTRVDKDKPGCINFEYVEPKDESACAINYEDCNDFKEAEKQRKKQQREEAKKKKQKK